MGQLWELKQRIELVIKDKKLDEFKIKGEIGLAAGVLIGQIKPDSPDNSEKMMKLKKAAQEILGVTF